MKINDNINIDKNKLKIIIKSEFFEDSHIKLLKNMKTVFV
jgi:hypothetical protein